ncbi:uncharacterized protein LOC128199985 [Galleria mellonella]|uniref:Uncharacterized protein LOC128199985 n=1 Tax=Galleria mellonella TaxID=7137 RepID=A0ABM3M8A0_GALME|nr:uncharacterized protein LOC128199985 [Galleria mellonella]
MAESLNCLNDPNDDSQHLGLKMNMDKTKIMSNIHVTPIPITIEDTTLEIVDEFQLQNWRKADVDESEGTAAQCNPYISWYIAQRDTAGLSEKPRRADAYLNNSFIYFCERLIHSQRRFLMKMEKSKFGSERFHCRHRRLGALGPIGG